MVIKGISDKILDRLSVLRWTRSILADKLSISEKSLQRMLDSEDIKKLDNFVGICKHLRLSPSHLLVGDILQHPFLEYFDIIHSDDDEGHLIDLMVEQDGQARRKHLVFTRGVGGEYYAEQKAAIFEGVDLVYAHQQTAQFKEQMGLKVAALTEDTPELELMEGDFVLAINQPSSNYTYLEYLRYGIGYVLAAFPNADGSTDYGILKPIDGKALTFQEALKAEDNALVFVDDKTYFHWLHEKLPKSKHQLEAFQSKVFPAINLLGEQSFQLYPVVAFVKNLTKRIAKELMEEMEELKEEIGE